MKVKIIAEAGVNHNGNLKIAKKLVDVAKNAKVDYIKFQSFFHDKLVVKKGIKAKYQKMNSNKNETQREMLKNRLEGMSGNLDLKDRKKLTV